MKKLVEETTMCPFEQFLGKKVELYCGVYIYTGVLSGVDENQLQLTDPKIVYETGSLTEGGWQKAQSTTSPRFVMRQAIESWGPAKC